MNSLTQRIMKAAEHGTVKEWENLPDDFEHKGVTLYAGEKLENSRLIPLIEALAEVSEKAKEELRVFHDGGTESEQTHAMIELQSALAKLEHVIGVKNE